jgi:glutaredoxin
VLDLHHVKFQDYNVLTDEDIRQGIKEYGDWPTIPQIYVNGKFVGGSDILVQMHKDGEANRQFFENNNSLSKHDRLPNSLMKKASHHVFPRRSMPKIAKKRKKKIDGDGGREVHKRKSNLRNNFHFICYNLFLN